MAQVNNHIGNNTESIVKLACLWNLAFHDGAADEIHILQPFALACIEKVLDHDRDAVEAFLTAAERVRQVAVSLPRN